MTITATTESLSALTGERFIRPQKNVDLEVVDLSALLGAALSEPENYPPLKDSIFAGDTIAIALQRELPCPKETLNALLDHLLTLNIEPRDITVILPGSMAELFKLKEDDYRPKMAEGDEQIAPPPIFPLQREFHSIDCQVHDPENSAGLSYLCASEAGEPVYINRLLVDADVVIPLGCPVGDQTARGVDCIYPTFGSSAAIHRFSDDSSLAKRIAETELANDSLGAFFAVQLIAGPRNSVTHVIAGVRQDAVSQAAKRSADTWMVACADNFHAAIVTVESRSHDQNWQDFVAALNVASRIVRDRGPIVVWSEISSMPDREIREACQARFAETIPAKLSKPMQHLAAILKDHPVYLKSKVIRSKIEELGLSVIENVDEVQQLTTSSDCVVILHDAHCCRLSIQ